jgi:hypothetical protein
MTITKRTPTTTTTQPSTQAEAEEAALLAGKLPDADRRAREAELTAAASPTGQRVRKTHGVVDLTDLPVGSEITVLEGGMLSVKIRAGNGWKTGVGKTIQAAIDDSNGLSAEEVKARARENPHRETKAEAKAKADAKETVKA